MENNLLPIGSVVEVSNQYLCVIIGYFGSDYSLPYFSQDFGDYEVVPYPFSCAHVKNNFAMFKKYKWFDFSSSVIHEKQITKVIFTGYIDEEFEEMKNKLNSN